MDTDSIAAKKRKTPKELPSLRLDILLRIGWGEGGRTPDEVSPGRGCRGQVSIPALNSQLTFQRRRNWRGLSFGLSAFATSTRCAMRRERNS